MTPRLSAALLLLFLAAGNSALSLAADTVEIGDAVMVSTASGTALPPDIALDARGGLHVLWVQKAPVPAEGEPTAGPAHAASDELFYRYAPPGSLEFRPAVRVNNIAGDVWGFAVSKPELAVGGDGVIHVLYPANDKQAGSGKGILAARYTRSTDGGKSFEPGRTLNSAATNDLSAVMHGGFAAAHAFGTIVASAGSDVHAYWIDTRFMKAEDTAGAIFAADSRDGGKTFGNDHLVFSEQVCPCCQLAAAAPGNKVLLAMRQVFTGGFRDSAVARSADAGRSFSEPVKAAEARWKIDGCPLKRTVIAVDAGNVYTAAFTAGIQPAGVYFSRSVNGGGSFEPARAMHPDAAVSDAPTLAAAPGGPLLMAWHGKAGGERRVFIRVSGDQGRTFGDVVEVPGPPSAAAYPEVVMDPDGRTAYLAWQQGQSAVVAKITLETAAPAVARTR